MRAWRGAFRAPPSACGAVGGREGEAWGGGRVRTPAQPPACPLRLRLQPAPRQRIAPKSPPPPHAATSGTLGHSAGRGQASVSVSAAQAGGRASAAPAQPPAPCFPLPAWCPWAGGASRGHRAPPCPHAFTNVVASETVVYATIYKCCFSCNYLMRNYSQMCRYPCSLEWVHTPRRGGPHEEKAGGTPDNGG